MILQLFYSFCHSVTIALSPIFITVFAKREFSVHRAIWIKNLIYYKQILLYKVRIWARDRRNFPNFWEFTGSLGSGHKRYQARSRCSHGISKKFRERLRRSLIQTLNVAMLTYIFRTRREWIRRKFANDTLIPTKSKTQGGDVTRPCSTLNCGLCMSKLY